MSMYRKLKPEEHAEYAFTRHAFSSDAQVLSVDVAEGTSKGVHGIALGDVGELSLEHVAERHGVVEGTVAARRRVQEGDGVSNGVLAVLNVLVLPDPPGTVDLSVVD
jgi:hypothetical protein